MMLYPVPMRHVMINLLESDLPRAALALARTAAFAPDPSDVAEHGLQTIPGEQFRQRYHQAVSRLEKILEHMPAAGLDSGHLEDAGTLPDLAQLTDLNERLGELWEECSNRQEALRELDEDQGLVGYLQDTLDRFRQIGLDLRVLDRRRRFLDLRVGTVSRFNIDRMRDALGLAGFVVYPFMASEDSTHVVVAGPSGEVVSRVDAVLESAGFRSLPVPAELQDDPDRVGRDLDERRRGIERQRRRLRADIEQCAERNRDFLARARHGLTLAQPFVAIDGAARISSRLVALSGWVPKRALAEIERCLQAELEQPFLLQARLPRPSEYAQVPTLLNERRWLAPFSALVRQYGVPGYGEIDPTLVFALTFVLMFGMMFGDVGHGLVIALAALIGRRRLGRFSRFGIAAGLSSAVFGLVYGSVFGFEELIHPLWLSPMSNPVLLLQVALAWGIGFIVLMTLLYVHNRLRVGDYAGALMETHGANNLLLYAGLLWLVMEWVGGAADILPPLMLLLSALTVLAVYKWRHNQAPLSERVMVVGVECFEAIMGNVSGTLSFLRVAAFSINHVALALAVFTLADLLGPTGHWLMVVGGNLFILILEGAIVAIQALRLEYYEGFSRFFSGDGQSFRPLSVDLPGSARSGFDSWPSTATSTTDRAPSPTLRSTS